MLHAEHIVYVYIVGILLYSLLIAMFSDTVSHLSEHRQSVVATGQTFAMQELFDTLASLPFLGSAVRAVYALRYRSVFVCDDGRVYLVLRRSARRSIDVSEIY